PAVLVERNVPRIFRAQADPSGGGVETRYLVHTIEQLSAQTPAGMRGAHAEHVEVVLGTGYFESLPDCNQPLETVPSIGSELVPERLASCLDAGRLRMLAGRSQRRDRDQSAIFFNAEDRMIMLEAPRDEESNEHGQAP